LAVGVNVVFTLLSRQNDEGPGGIAQDLWWLCGLSDRKFRAEERNQTIMHPNLRVQPAVDDDTTLWPLLGQSVVADAGARGQAASGIGVFLPHEYPSADPLQNRDRV
jgi:hypothetical protein